MSQLNLDFTLQNLKTVLICREAAKYVCLYLNLWSVCLPPVTSVPLVLYKPSAMAAPKLEENCYFLPLGNLFKSPQF